jgi:hypothetical protein
VILYQVLLNAQPAKSAEEAGIFPKGEASQALCYRDPNKPRWFPGSK